MFQKKTYLDGITLSGGDPLTQSLSSLQDLYKFVKWFKTAHPDKTIWIYTGFVLEDILNEKDSEIGQVRLNIIKECDTLVDGPFIEELKDLSLPFRGSSNQRIIDVELNKFHW
jgi:anaerobic ribonucleoside-triphosphate reductase activating protein